MGTALPEQFEECSERHYFAEIRLRARPAWRASGGEDVVEAMLRFNAYLMTRTTIEDPDGWRVVLMNTAGP